MVIKNRHLFRISRVILLQFPIILQFFKKFREKKRHLLIIKTDAIGDYILFRNYIEILRQSKKFSDYKIDLLGNLLWKDIALNYDAPFINEFYFIHPNDMYEQPFKLLQLGWRLFRNNYEVVLLPSFTRTLIADGLAALTSAAQIIGFQGDNESIASRYKIKTDDFYSVRLLLPENIYFEFERSRFFFESILQAKIELDWPVIDFQKYEKAGVIIFPGAGISKRSWPKENFLKLILHIIKEFPAIRISLAGGNNEAQTGEYLAANLASNSIQNLIGKTSLPELIELIGNSKVIIANETSAVHIAAAAQTKAICILGGGHFDRFAPYPTYMTYRPECIYHKMDCDYCNWNCKFLTGENECYPCISNIDFRHVWDEVSKSLSSDLENSF